MSAVALLRPSPLPIRCSASSTTRRSKVTPPPSVPMKKKVLVPVGLGTEEMEAVILVDVLRRAGADVLVASVEQGLEVRASSGTRIVADSPIAECAGEIFDLVALPGGMPGAARLRDCDILRKITSKQAEEKRLYGAICAAPAVTLKPWGLLKRKQMTCHPAFWDKLPTFWAVKSNIQVSGELTTSRGPGTSFEFALSFIEQLYGEPMAQEMAEKLLMRKDSVDLQEFNKIEWSFDYTPHVLVPVANGTEEMELVMLIDILRRAKANVTVASVEKSIEIVASQKTKIVADKFIDDASGSKYDLIILPGGATGAMRLHKSKILKSLLREQHQCGRILGGICSSPATLQKQGLLKEKVATAHPDVAGKLIGRVNNDSKVVIDGSIITGKGLGTVIDFALIIVNKLFGHARTRSVAEGLVFEYPKS